MAFTVTLYSHKKRDNSTKRPTDSGTTYNCVMKHGCGILNPSISLDLGLSTDPSNFNYAYISAFGRYYFIEEWYFEERLWTAQLKVDVLATYKTQIGDANLYVLRSSAENNGRVIDTLYPTLTGCNFESTEHSNPWTGTTYVVGVINRNASFGSLNYYVVDGVTLSNIASFLMDPANVIIDDYGFNLDDASEGLQLSLVDPIQYIKTCMMMPVDAGDYTDLPGDTRIYCFNWNTNQFGRPLYSRTRIRKTYTFNIIKHPDTNARGNYVNTSPYTVLTLVIPPYGCIDIDTSVTCNASTLNVEVEIDPITGKGVLIVKCNGIVLNRLESQIGVPISLSSVTRDWVGGITSTVGAVSGAIGGAMAGAGGGVLGAIGGAIGGSAGAIGDAVKSLMPRAQTVGSTGSFVANRGEFRLDHQFFRPVADDNTHNGRPLCAMRTLKNLGGYMLIQDGDVEISGTRTEDEQVKNYLETGFYYE